MTDSERPFYSIEELRDHIFRTLAHQAAIKVVERGIVEIAWRGHPVYHVAIPVAPQILEDGKPPTISIQEFFREKLPGLWGHMDAHNPGFHRQIQCTVCKRIYEPEP